MASKSVGSGKSVSTFGVSNRSASTTWWKLQLVAPCAQPFTDGAGEADVVVLDHESAHRTDSSLGPNDFRKLVPRDLWSAGAPAIVPTSFVSKQLLSFCRR